MPRTPTPRQLAMLVTEDATGGAAEMRARLGTRWALPLDPVLITRVRRRCVQLEGDLRALRRALDTLEEAA